MKLNGHAIAFFGCGVVSLFACNAEDGDAAVPPLRTGLVQTRSMDFPGTRWRKRGPARIENLPIQENLPPEQPGEHSTEAEKANWTDQQWMDHVRPIAFYEGDEYELAEDDATYLARFRAARSWHGEGKDVERTDHDDEAHGVEIKRGLGTRVLMSPSTDQRALANNSSLNVRTGAFSSDITQFTTSRPPGAGGCTMTLIGPTTAISSAHCFFNSSTVLPTWQPTKTWGFNAKTPLTAPQAVFAYGYVTGCYVVTIPSMYAINDNIAYDYAVIEFTCGLTPGVTLGYAGFAAASYTQINTSKTALSGYPGSLPTLPPNGAVGANWNYPTDVWQLVDGYYTVVTTGYQITHFLDTTGGQSGAAIQQLLTVGQSYTVTGIHRGGYGGPGSGIPQANWYNYARLVDSDVVGFVVANSSL